MRRSDSERDRWEERTGILNIPTRLIRWFSGIFTTVWLILTGISSYNSFNAHSGESWDAQTVGIIWAGAPNIGFALPAAYILTEVIDMVFGTWYRQRTRQRAQEEGMREGLEEGMREGLKKGIQEGLEKGIQEGLEKGMQEGRQEQHERWLEWLDRRQQAEASGLPFDEPPPGLSGEHPTEE